MESKSKKKSPKPSPKVVAKEDVVEAKNSTSTTSETSKKSKKQKKTTKKVAEASTSSSSGDVTDGKKSEKEKVVERQGDNNTKGKQSETESHSTPVEVSPRKTDVSETAAAPKQQEKQEEKVGEEKVKEAPVVPLPAGNPIIVYFHTMHCLQSKVRQSL